MHIAPAGFCEDALAQFMDTDLGDLVAHREWIAADSLLEDLVERFHRSPVSYVAVLQAERVVGVVSTESIGRLTAGRYGFALFARETVTSRMESGFLTVTRSAGLLTALSSASTREGHEFLNDVVLVDDDGKYLGMIPFYRLAQLQSRLLQAQHAKEAANSEKALTEQKVLLQSVLHSMADGVVVSDALGRIHAFNPAAVSILKIQFDLYASGGWQREYQFLDPETGRPYRRRDTPLARAARGEAVRATEVFALHRATNVGIWLSINAMPLRLDNDSSQWCVLVFRDITEQKEAEESLRRAKDLAERADRAKSVFLANMSHELRTPLNAIIGYSEMLVEELSDRNSHEHLSDLNKIHGAGKHLLSVINNVLDLSKIESGRTEVVIEEFDFRPVIEEAVSTIKPLAMKNSNQVSLTVADAMHLHSDRMKLLQVLLNLLGNACKFTEKGSISVVAEFNVLAGQKLLEVRINDTGIGIQPEQLKSIFEPFVQAESWTAARYGGSGLGLAISRRFCRLLGGDLSADSAPGQGSTFYMQLPCVFQVERPVDENGVGSVENALAASLAKLASRG